MAAQLSYKNGNAEMIYTGETPWHQEGTKFETAPTWDELMKVVDYDIHKLPYFYPAPNGEGMVESLDSFYLQRADTRRHLGSVGSQYKVITNRDAFAALRPLIDDGVATVETAGVLRDGADAWLLCKWQLDKFGPDVREVFGDEVQPYSTVMANHAGRRPVLLGNTPIRIVCANTLGAAETDARENGSRWRSIRHTQAESNRLADTAADLFHGVVERYEVIARQYKALKLRLLTQAEFKTLVLDVVAPDPRLDPDFEPAAKLAELVVDRAMTKRAKLSDLWFSGKGHTGEPTAWYAYNGVVEALDHNRSLWPTRAGCYRTASLLNGALAEMKGKVLDNLTRLAVAA